MKILKIFRNVVIVVFLLAIVVLSGLLVFFKTYDLNRFKPQLIEAIKKQTGLTVSISKIAFDLSLSDGIILNLKKLSVKDAPKFSDGNLLEAGVISLHVQLLPLIMKQQIISPEVVIDSFRAHIIQNSSGNLNLIAVLGSLANPSSHSTESSERMNPQDVHVPIVEQNQTQKGGASSSSAMNVPAILVNSFRIKNGEIVYWDRPQMPEKVIPIKDINFDVSKFSLYEPFNFNLSCSLWRDKNVAVQGMGLINMSGQEFRLDKVLVTFDFEQISLSEIGKDIAGVEDSFVKGCKSGKLNFLINEIVLGSEGIRSLSAEASLSDLRLDFVDNKFPINSFDAKVEISKESIVIKEILGKIASGEIHIDGKISDYLTNPQEAVQLSISGISLPDVISKEELGYDLTGIFTSTLNVTSSSFDPAQFLNNLKGTGKIHFKDATLHDFNILDVVIEKIAYSIESLKERIQNNLPERLKEKLKEKDTRFEKMEFPVSFSGGVVSLESAEVSTSELSVTVNGQMDEATNMTISSYLNFNEDLSRSLVEAVNEFSCLVDLNGKVLIRFKDYQGTLANLKAIYPDLKDLSDRVGKCLLKNVIQKAIGGKSGQQNATSGDSVLVPVFDGQKVPVDVDPILDKALDIFNDLF